MQDPRSDSPQTRNDDPLNLTDPVNVPFSINLAGLSGFLQHPQGYHHLSKEIDNVYGFLFSSALEFLIAAAAVLLHAHAVRHARRNVEPSTAATASTSLKPALCTTIAATWITGLALLVKNPGTVATTPWWLVAPVCVAAAAASLSMRPPMSRTLRAARSRFLPIASFTLLSGWFVQGLVRRGTPLEDPGAAEIASTLAQAAAWPLMLLYDTLSWIALSAVPASWSFLIDVVRLHPAVPFSIAMAAAAIACLLFGRRF